MRPLDHTRGRLQSLLAAAAIAAGFAAMGFEAIDAFACTGAQWITLTPNSGVAGASVTFTGHLFQSGSTPVTVRWNGLSGPVLWSGPVASDGTVTFTFVVPQQQPGWNYINAYQYNAQGNPVLGSPAHVSFHLTPPPATPPQQALVPIATAAAVGRSTSAGAQAQGVAATRPSGSRSVAAPPARALPAAIGAPADQPAGVASAGSAIVGAPTITGAQVPAAHVPSDHDASANTGQSIESGTPQTAATPTRSGGHGSVVLVALIGVGVLILGALLPLGTTRTRRRGDPGLVLSSPWVEDDEDKDARLAA